MAGDVLTDARSGKNGRHALAGLFRQSEITMPKINLSRMTVETLMDLRKRVEETLHKRRAELQRQLEMIGGSGGPRIVRGGGSVLKGRKLPPKYRGPAGNRLTRAPRLALAADDRVGASL